jgi:hypothetical protein
VRGTRKKWERSNFFIVEAVEYRPDDDRVRVRFRNRDVREIETSTLWGKRPGLPDWTGVRIDAATKSALLVPTVQGQPTTEGEIAEIPSDVIREAADEDYRSFVQKQAAAWKDG